MDVDVDVGRFQWHKQTRSGQRSLIWSVFVEIDDQSDEADKTICLICSRKVKHSGGTRNLWQHLERHHVETCAELQLQDFARKSGQGVEPAKSEPETTVLVETSTDVSRKISVGDSPRKSLKLEDSSRIDNSLLYLIVKNKQPISIVNSDSFLQFSRALNKNYEMPPASEVVRMIDAKYEKVARNVGNLLDQLKYVSIIIGIRTNGSSEKYLTVTVRGLSDDLQVREFVLGSRHMPQMFRCDKIAEVVEDMVKYWKLDGKVVGVVANSSFAMKNAVRKLIRRRVCKARFLCFQHTLMQCIEDALKSQPLICETIQKFRDLFYEFQDNDVLCQNLKFALNSFGMSDRELNASTETQWNNTYHILQTAVELQNPLALVARNTSSSCAVTLSESDFDLARRIVDVLKAFDEAASIVSSEQNAMLSSVHPLVEHLIGSLSSGEDKEEVKREVDDGYFENNEHLNLDIIDHFKEELKKCLLCGFQDVLFSSLYRLVSFLDPRFKSTYCKFPDVITLAKNEITQILASSLPSSSTDSVEAVTLKLTTDFPRIAGRKRSFWHKIEENNIAAKRSRVQSGSETESELHSKFNAEFSAYKREEPLVASGDVLTYWKKRQRKLPMLSSLVKKYLCIPATSLPTRKSNPTEDDKGATQSSDLTPETVEKMIFLSKNWVQ